MRESPSVKSSSGDFPILSENSGLAATCWVHYGCKTAGLRKEEFSHHATRIVASIDRPASGLFGAGTCAGLTDGELLERFRASRDEGGERAFEALVTRHGPMVMGVCRNILNDPTQTSTTRSRRFSWCWRAGPDAIRKSESVGSWLYGVAVRVAARGRVASIRRQIRDRRTIAAAGTVAAVATESRSAPSIDRDDGAAIVHQEVVRLPEKYRAPIVLCYLEGLTHDEAAARLSWPVGTVRSRLSRARDRLRSRLTRRGVTAPSTFGPMAAWLIADHGRASTASAVVGPAGPSLHIPGPFRHSLRDRPARDRRLVVGGRDGTGSRSPDDHDAQETDDRRLCVLSLGIAGVGGGAFLVRASRAQELKAWRPAASASLIRGHRTPSSSPVDRRCGRRTRRHRSVAPTSSLQRPANASMPRGPITKKAGSRSIASSTPWHTSKKSS